MHRVTGSAGHLAASGRGGSGDLGFGWEARFARERGLIRDVEFLDHAGHRVRNHDAGFGLSVGGFARGCHAGGITRFALLSAVGSSAKSSIRYVRVMGLKEETVQGAGFQRLAVFRPGIIGGNVHTPRYVAWLGRLIPGRFGTIEQDDIGRAFVAEFVSSPVPDGVVYFENGAMRQRSRALGE